MSARRSVRRPTRRAASTTARLPAGWFTDAALERIAQTVRASDTKPGSSVAADIVKAYLQGEPSHGLRNLDMKILEMFGDESYTPTIQLHAFAEWLELAATARYVDLRTWAQLDSFVKAVDRFRQREKASEKAVDLTLVDALTSRIAKSLNAQATRDDAAFFAFASYLELETRLAADRRCAEFFEETVSGKKSASDDLAFLVTPRHFAQAIAEGKAGAHPAQGAATGLAALRYLEWLAEIVRRVDHNKDLQAKLLRHAGWAHGLEAILDRFRTWATRMAEWGPLGVDEDGETAWRVFEDEVMFYLMRSLKQHGLLREWPSKVLQSAEASIDMLVAQGRTGAAMQRLRREIDRHAARLSDDFDGWRDVAAELVADCMRLADLGDVDTAAARMAMLMDAILQKCGSDDQTTLNAAAVLARAANPPAAESPSESTAAPNVVTAPPSASAVRPPPRSRSAGEFEAN